MKNILEELTEGDGEGAERDREGEGEGEDAERCRKQAKLTQQVGAVLDLIPEDTIKNVFGTQDRREIWNELNTSVDHRRRVIDWLDAMISAEVSGESKGMNERMQTQKVREAYRMSPSIAMRRYIDKVQSPQCPIGRETVTADFTATWAPPRESFEEALPDTDVYLDQKISAEGLEDMEEYMVEEKHISDVIDSRDDQSVCGVEGISYQLFKAAKRGSVEFMKHIIKASIRCGRVMTSWKEARTILLHKRGDREVIGSWLPISITNCAYLIFTCLLARAFQDINARYGIFTDPLNGFIKKTNGCSEHGIMLNELFLDARRSHKGLVMTTIDFTNAFGSVLHELIMLTMR
jgi:hypothetical protein